MERCWILVGMMGAGKSAVGRELSAQSGRPFVDTDQLLQNRFGRPVSQIFQVYGEDTFRAHETSILGGLEPSACILSTGGGIVTRPDNWVQLRRLGITAYIDAPEEELVARLSASKKRRPLLEVENWEGRVSELLAARTPLYRQADIVLPIRGMDIAGVAAALLREFTEREATP